MEFTQMGDVQGLCRCYTLHGIKLCPVLVDKITIYARVRFVPVGAIHCDAEVLCTLYNVKVNSRSDFMKISYARRNWWFSLACLSALILQTACQPIQRSTREVTPAVEAAPALSTTPEKVTGAFTGNLSIAGLELDITVTLSNENGSYSGTIDIPQQGASGIPLHDIVIEPPSLEFQILEGAQLGQFVGEVDAEGAISGTFTQAGYEGTFALSSADSATDDKPSSGSQASTPVAEEATETYADPQGLFSAPIPTNWTANEGDGFVLLSDPENKLKVYLLAIESADGDLQAVIDKAWAKVNPGFDLKAVDTMEPPTSAGLEKNLVITYDTPNENITQALASLFQGVAYVLLFEGDLVTLQKRAAQVGIIQSGLDILAMEDVDLSERAPLPVDETITTELETFINAWMPKFKIPGAAVAIVQDGKVVYMKGFGVRNEAGDPITPQTHMMIGSTGKSLTTLMMATLVDDGKMTWDTPAAEIYPQFAVKDPQLSKTITMRNLVCACTGVPRRDFEFILNADNLSAEDIVASLKDFEFFTEFGEAFQYSNQMVATGGYVAAVAASGEQANLMENYAAALEERVLDPIGMTHTTTSFEEVLATDNYATPHGYNWQSEYEPLALDIETVLSPVAPAGVHWSTLEDMSQYMLTQLADGVAPNGERVVSPENLAEVRKPQIQVADKTSYGLGWLVGEYKGQPVIDHGGNTLGFTSEFSFMPNAQLGVIVLTNAQGTNSFSGAVSGRLLELVFEQKPEIETGLDFIIGQIDEASEKARKQVESSVDTAAVEAWVGDYQNEALGNLTLMLSEGELVADVGEFSTGLLPKNDDKGKFEGYIATDPPLPGLLLKLEKNDAGEPIVIFGSGVAEYNFERVE